MRTFVIFFYYVVLYFRESVLLFELFPSICVIMLNNKKQQNNRDWLTVDPLPSYSSERVGTIVKTPKYIIVKTA